MKIKNHYYCLIDNNNKPDFRYIFAKKTDAEKKLKQIKNSTTGETLFVSKYKRDFFIDGIKKEFIDSDKPVNIKKGCWTTLRTKKISLLDTIHPEIYFKELIKETPEINISQVNLEFNQSISEKNNSTQPVNAFKTNFKTKQHLLKKRKRRFFSTYFTTNNLQKKKKESTYATKISLPSKKQLSFKTFKTFFIESNYSFLKTKLFALNLALISIICLATVTYINDKSNKKIASILLEKQQTLVTKSSTPTQEVAVLGEMDDKDSSTKNEAFDENIELDNIDTMVFDTLIQFEKVRADQLEDSIKKMVAGTPMEKMAPHIAKKDKIVAAFLVGISKKESNYGRRVPVLNGEDCFNYWGYRGIRTRMGSGGHTCFDSPEDAVDTVGGRIERLVKSGVDTPQEMVLWKCGSNCNATGGWPAAHKWIKDVNMYYTKMLTTAQEDEEESEKIKVLNETMG